MIQTYSKNLLGLRCLKSLIFIKSRFVMGDFRKLRTRCDHVSVLLQKILKYSKSGENVEELKIELYLHCTSLDATRNGRIDQISFFIQLLCLYLFLSRIIIIASRSVLAIQKLFFDFQFQKRKVSKKLYSTREDEFAAGGLDPRAVVVSASAP